METSVKKASSIPKGYIRMPTGARPAGAFQWDMVRGCWLNNDGSVYIKKPKGKKSKPRDAVGWDSVKGEWVGPDAFSESVRREDTYKRRRKLSRPAQDGERLGPSAADMFLYVV